MSSTLTSQWDWTMTPVDHPRDFAYAFADHLDSEQEIEASYDRERRHLEECPWPDSRTPALKHLDAARADALAYAFSRRLARPSAAPPASDEVRMPQPGAEPPEARWEALAMNEPRAMLAADRELGLPSDSEHDMVLANICAEAEWSGQEIADLLAWNRRQRHEEKPKHRTYYVRTVGKALARKRNG